MINKKDKISLLDYQSLFKTQPIMALKINLLSCLIGIKTYEEKTNLHDEDKIKQLLKHKDQLYFLVLTLYLEENNLREEINNLALNKNPNDRTKEYKFLFNWLNEQLRLELFNILIKKQKDTIKEEDQFLYNNLEELFDILREHAYSCHIDMEKYDNNKKLSSLTKSELEYLTIEFLKKLDPSNKLIEYFIEILNLNKIKYENDSHWSTITNGNDTYITAPLTKTTSDFVCLIHEFAHYITGRTHDCKQLNQVLPTLEEFPSIFFEYLATTFLCKIGFSFEEVSKITKVRLQDVCNNYNKTAIIFYSLTQTENISYETLLPLFNNNISLKIIADCIDEANKNLLLYKDFFINKYKYLIGSLLAEEVFHNIDRNKIKYIIEMMENLPEVHIQNVFKNLDLDSYNLILRTKKKVRNK